MWVVSLLYRKNNGKCLFTCAIRPAAIYGPGEERHSPRIVSFAKLGLLPFKIGDSNVKTDWVYVDNLGNGGFEDLTCYSFRVSDQHF